MANYEDQAYCNFDSSTTKAVAGKDIILAVFDSTGANLLAISGQKGLTINRAADSIEVTSKDTKGGWKSKIAGMKEWSVDNDGFYIPSHASHKAIGTAFQNSDPVCIKIVNGKTKKSMFGGLAYVTDYSLEHRTENPCVPCSIQGGTTFKSGSCIIPMRDFLFKEYLPYFSSQLLFLHL